LGSISLQVSSGKTLETTPAAGYIALLRGNRGFRQLWLGQVVSQLAKLGDWFNTIALYTIILTLTGSGRDIGRLLVARFLPSFIFGSLSGVVADRFSRRSIMIISDLLRTLVVLGFLFVRRADQLWILYSLLLLTGATTGLVYLVGKMAHDAGIFHMGISPAANSRDTSRHINYRWTRVI
jgi:Na+/melibiose symporter-like transporter